MLEALPYLSIYIATLTNLSLDEEEKNSQSKTKPHANELSEGKAKPVRHAYVRKPFLYSKYFSDSDDERTVEQRRQSIVSVGFSPAHILALKLFRAEIPLLVWGWFVRGGVFCFFSLQGFFLLYYSCAFFRFPSVWHSLLSSTALC